MKTKIMKETRGITLIALVITIIVLLILAGVAISMLAGDNGILAQAASAKVKTEESATLEHIRLAITTARANEEYEFDETTLNNELTGYFGAGKYSAVKDSDDVWTIKVNGVEVKITPDGEEVTGKWYFVKDGSITNGTTKLKLGDIVKYDPISGDGATVEPYKSLKENNGYAEQEYTVGAATGKTWRVLGIDEAGQILIMPTTNIEKTNTDGDGYFYLGSDDDATLSQAAYKNSESELDKISAIYGHGKGASGARSVKVEDVNKITGYDPNKTGNGKKYGENSINEYGNNVTYSWTSTENRVESKGTNGKTGSGSYSSYKTNGFNWFNETTKTWEKAIQDITNPLKIATLKSTYYYYYPYSLTTSSSTSGEKKGIGTDDTNLYEMLFKDTNNDQYYWLGSSCVSTDTGLAWGGVRVVNGGYVDCYYLFNSHGYCNYNYYGVRPAVSLKSDVKLAGNSTDGWTIE